MHWIGAAFLIAVLSRVGVRLWLASRQIAAVRARRSKVPRLFAHEIAVADHEAAADYAVARMRIARVGAVAGAVLALVLTFGGGVAAADALWRSTGLAQPWLGVGVVLTVLAVFRLVQLPFSVWRTFGLEARFGFNRTPPRLFAADLAKRTVLAVAIVGPLAAGAILLMERAGPAWWLFAWVGWLAVMLGTTWAWPRFVAPWFNRFTPLADTALEKRLTSLLERCGFTSGGVFVMDGSRRSAHSNAYFTGIGRSKRVVFFDTLLAKLGPAEIEAVLAHELGHFRLHHVRQRLVVSAALALGSLALLAWLARHPSFYAALGVPSPSAHAALLLFSIAMPAFTFFATPLAAWWSRRHELQADDFAVRHANARDLAGALLKICRDNASNLLPDRWYSAFYDSHPPALVRVARLRAVPLPPPCAGPRSEQPVLQ
ncbi:MAG TPA: M48 family metallopeptidase [Gammaproteobacteria bacterium]